MTLYKQWVELMESQTDETFEEFWEEYSDAESRLYAHILENADKHFAGATGISAPSATTSASPM